jgi:hypothetical protein
MSQTIANLRCSSQESWTSSDLALRASCQFCDTVTPAAAGITLVFGLVTGFASARQPVRPVLPGARAPAEQLGTAAGLLRTFGHAGSTASSAIIGVFHTSVSDDGVHPIAWIMIGVSLALALIFVLDRTLPGQTAS